MDKFVKHKLSVGGRANICKECKNRYIREYRRSNIEKYNNRYRNTEKYLEQQRVGQRKYNAENPKKIEAHRLTKKVGTKKVICAVCGGVENLEYHHSDYDKPLEVIILCRDCHRKAHNAKTN